MMWPAESEDLSARGTAILMCNMPQAPPQAAGPDGHAMKLSQSFWVLLLGSALALCLCAAAASSWHATPVMHSNTPAGYDVLVMDPTGAVISFLGLIECPELEGAQQRVEGAHSRIVNADGKTLIHYPRHFSFRITASLRKMVLIEPSDRFTSSEPPNDLLLKLRFRLRAYHGLEAREIPPESVQMIGVPADVPYDERVYRISFKVERLSVTDRCVLEVLSPAGQRLTKFHFDLL
jgi:hypothetical protein